MSRHPNCPLPECYFEEKIQRPQGQLWGATLALVIMLTGISFALVHEAWKRDQADARHELAIRELRAKVDALQTEVRRGR